MSIFGLWMAAHSPIANGSEGLESFWERELFRSTPSLRGLTESLLQATAENGPVLLTGEIGTGKTHLARLIHDRSHPKVQPLLVISCCALAQGGQASELFARLSAAVPGTDKEPSSTFATAGTLLLKDVDGLGLEQQVQLLRLLETAKGEPAGSSPTRPCRTRVMATSKINLKEAVAQGKFSSDLYDRLRVVALHLPPLRERREDIAPLVRGLVKHFAKELRKGTLSLDPGALATLEAFPWPGNLRQLRDVVHQAVLASPGPDLLKWDLPLGVREWATPARDSVPAPPGSGFLFRKLSFR